MNPEIEYPTTCRQYSRTSCNELEEDNYDFDLTNNAQIPSAEAYISEIVHRVSKMLGGQIDFNVKVEVQRSCLDDEEHQDSNDKQVKETNVTQNLQEKTAKHRIKSLLHQKEEIENIVRKISADDVFQPKDWKRLQDFLEQSICRWKRNSYMDCKTDSENGLEIGCIVREKITADLLRQVVEAGRGERRTRSGFTKLGNNEMDDEANATIKSQNKEHEVKDKLSDIGKVFMQYQAILKQSEDAKRSSHSQHGLDGLEFKKKKSFKDLFESKLSELENDYQKSGNNNSSSLEDEPGEFSTLFNKGKLARSKWSTSSISLCSEVSLKSSHTTVGSVCPDLNGPSSSTVSLADEDLRCSNATISSEVGVRTHDETPTTASSTTSLRRSPSSSTSVDDGKACQVFSGPKFGDLTGSRRSCYDCELEIAYYQETLAKIKKEKLERERQQVVINIYIQQLLDIEKECLKELDKIQQFKQDLIPLAKIVQQWKMSANDNLEFLSMPPPENRSKFDYIKFSDEDQNNLVQPPSILEPPVSVAVAEKVQADEEKVAHTNNPIIDINYEPLDML